jgi:hypothetical protein
MFLEPKLHDNYSWRMERPNSLFLATVGLSLEQMLLKIFMETAFFKSLIVLKIPSYFTVAGRYILQIHMWWMYLPYSIVPGTNQSYILGDHKQKNCFVFIESNQTGARWYSRSLVIVSSNWLDSLWNRLLFRNILFRWYVPFSSKIFYHHAQQTSWILFFSFFLYTYLFLRTNKCYKSEVPKKCWICADFQPLTKLQKIHREFFKPRTLLNNDIIGKTTIFRYFW